MAGNLVQVEEAPTEAQFSLENARQANHGENCYQIFLSVKYEESYISSKCLSPKAVF